ncbi:acetyl-CoA carboxylase carboxyl transferase subunit alpha [Breznakia sp. PF5-3]|uniref:acetyl-CoA carboxylase carboxyltransferase subunit alpha n=1 Tax=unclassified Breznakia TaxID=2623764 RepID=UPI0024076BF1|nr:MULTISPECIES: acetyl-CoA carboxylase carboxyltransferase subunit alpha [unclassified Breznakia]MDL2276187.1 acetyl-CoA carboxylase carboxyltransferase subunit alpha [Breznakia sp. OttesenSCG-928-G09]MDF9824708.1 acetyl-CoA carboxylase carboxyl transferase subunit alpha [Breznakia sp. PM6-1]MDF9835371.1 acetyl-CoA carboxylase carboxyl transferase subunit alpha [Breznakia sp. PF5-3]MDF9836970.1 acetyl-CoA carboxylase carboxyl transferase subunit alpha [Breznakia sp. PFB2-8]MDF9859606.1 acetyl
MNLRECEILIKSLEAEKAKIENVNTEYYDELDAQIKRIQKETYSNLSAWDRVYLARHADRPKAQDYIDLLFDNFYELHGDRGVKDDRALIGGIAYFNGTPVTILAQAKGKTTKENIERNFGMMNPEGYRKALRLAKQAEKFGRPIINIVDTSGAFPGKEAEERGQAEAIAKCLYTFSNLRVPIISIVISEGGSGGALALSVADRIAMLENAIYSILSPEGFASILWKDESRAQEAAEVMKLTSYDLLGKKVIDAIIKEPLGGAQECIEYVAENMKKYIEEELAVLSKMRMKDMLEKRYMKFRKIGMI